MAEIARLVLVAAMTALFAPAAAIIHESPYVSNGRGSFVIGQRLQSSNLFGSPRDYAAFWGVPYAQAPTGKLRFMPPQPVALPNGQLNASNASVPVCAQLLRGPAVEMGSEDCLTLQIFTPNYDPGANLSVLVFVHGGGFVYGRAPRDGVQFLMEHDVVVVAVDYRLGIFGWLSFEDEHVPGNQGLLDQVEALRWVQENIQLFGGNKDSVTLVGFSAGSASALLLTMSPMARGLFHRVVAVSGSPLNPWARQVSPRKNALKLAQMANCTTTSTMASVACLQSKSMSELIRVQRDFQDWLQHPFSPFAPVVDTYSKTPLLHDDPTNLVKSKTAVMDVPILMSITTHEGLFTAAEFMYKPDAMKKLNDEWEQWAPNLLHFHDGRVPDAEKPLMAKKIRDHYLPNGTLAEHRDALVMLMSDRNFVVGVSEYAVARAAAQNSPIYVYAFGYRGEFSLTSSESGLPDDMGVSHADDIQYIFEFLNWSGRMSRPSDLDIRRSMLTMWKTFANASVPILQGVNWQPQPRASEGSALHYLKIAAPTNMSMVQQKDAGQASFWTQLSIKESGNHSARATASVSLSLEMFFLAVLSVILF